MSQLTKTMPTEDTVAQKGITGLDLSLFRVPQEFDVNVVEKIIVPKVTRPPKGDFVRTHPSNEYWLDLGVIEKTNYREFYLVPGTLQDQLREDNTFSIRRFVTAITRGGNVFIWPIKLTENDWSRSDLAAAEYAREKWVRVSSNIHTGRYETYTARAEGNAPVWPEVSISELLEKAFDGRIIDSWEHPVLRELRGEV